MTMYLSKGWYDPHGGRALRAEVIDGAMDIAGLLLRARVPATLVQRVALKVRQFMTLADPHMQGVAKFGERERGALGIRLERYSANAPELDGFLHDCLEHLKTPSDLLALYLHLIHVTRMMQLLSLAVSERRTVRRSTTKKRAAPAPKARASRRLPTRKAGKAKKTAKRTRH